MAFRIFTNTTSQFAQRALSNNSGRLGDIIRSIGSGDRLQRASTDSASYAISENLRADTRVLRQAVRNANDGLALVNSAGGSVGEITNALIRARELAEQSANGTLNSSDRQAIQLEFEQEIASIDAIARNTDFNGRKLLNGSLSASSGNPVIIQIGLDSSADNRFNLNELLDIPRMDSTGLGIDTLSAGAQNDAVLAVTELRRAIKFVNTVRTQIGSVQERITHAVSNLGSNIEGLVQADSSLRDADLGNGFAQLTRDQILVQASTAMVGQANIAPRTALQLLQ